MEIAGFAPGYYNRDCMDFLRSAPDNSIDLAIVDPPYGIGETWKKDRPSKFYKHNSTYKNDKIPSGSYFLELRRATKHQIVWGWNYYSDYLPPSSNIIFWDKGKDAIKQHGAAGELAWTSITKYPLIKFDFLWNGCCRAGERVGFHPYEKPKGLYRWLMQNYWKPGWTVLDTHVGSANSLAVFEEFGATYWGFELDKEYYDLGLQNIAKHKAAFAKRSDDEVKLAGGQVSIFDAGA